MRKVCVALIAAGIAVGAILAFNGVPPGGAYVLPGCLFAFGGMGLIVTYGED